MTLPTWLTSIFSGSSILDVIAKGIDELNISPEEKLAFKERMTLETNRALEAAAAQAQAAYASEIEDRKDARAMVAANPHGPVTYLMIFVGVVVVLFFFGLLAGLVFFEVPIRNERVLDLLIGFLGAGFGAVMNYLFGSSTGSAKNGEALRNLAQQK